MAFVRLVEVFAPSFEAGARQQGTFYIRREETTLVRQVRQVADSCDLLLVTAKKNPGLVELSSVRTAAMLQDRAGVRAVPAIVARDGNRRALRSAVLTSISLGLRTLFLAWGDPYTTSSGEPSAHGYPTLSSFIEDSISIARRTGVELDVLAPVRVDSLDAKRGAELARSRLAAGASLLLAQPPTADRATFEEHLRLLRRSSLGAKVLLHVFPFRSASDVDRCASEFGWSLPDSLRRLARRGEPALIREARRVVGRAKGEGLAGIYLSTRGRPSVARTVFG